MESAVAYQIAIPWPTHPLRTPTGRPARNKMAGKLLPWLSANIVHALNNPYRRPGAGAAPPISRVHRYKAHWRELACAIARTAEASEYPGTLPIPYPVLIEVRLYRNPANEMDQGGLIEGAKPLIDGLVLAGLLQGDGPKFVTYDPRGAVYRTPKGTQRVELLLRPRS